MYLLCNNGIAMFLVNILKRFSKQWVKWLPKSTTKRVNSLTSHARKQDSAQKPTKMTSRLIIRHNQHLLRAVKIKFGFFFHTCPVGRCNLICSNELRQQFLQLVQLGVIFASQYRWIRILMSYFPDCVPPWNG